MKSIIPSWGKAFLRGKALLKGRSFWALGLIIFAVSISAGPAYPLTVKPGGLDHFSVRMPSEIRAGEEAKVSIEAFDSHGNVITNYAETGRDIEVSVTGSAQTGPKVIKASSFSSGSAEVAIFDKKAETVVLTLRESGASASVFSKEVTVVPNKLDRFEVAAPEGARAGRAFEVKVTAKDAYGNIVTDGSIGKDIRTASIGKSELKNIGQPIFAQGESTVSMVSEKAGVAAIEIKDASKGASGTAEIAIAPAPVSRFDVIAPLSAEAGKAFEVRVTALDEFNNAAYDYQSYGKGVNISGSGKSAVSPSFIKPSEFRDGTATVGLTYETAEEIALTAVENGGKEQGTSAFISVSPSSLDKFVVRTPDDAVAGQRFKLVVEAYDRYGNLIADYNLRGGAVGLTHTGRGTLTPSVIAASEFSGGRATVEASYDRAEDVVISGSTASMEASTASMEKQAALEKETKPVLAKPEAKPALKEAKKAKPETKVEKPQTLEKAEKPRTVEKAQKPLVAEKPQVAQKPQTIEKAKEPQVAEKPLVAKKIEKVFDVTEINMIEAQNKALLVITIPGLSSGLSYKEGLESSGGKDWVRVRLSPAEDKLKKPPVFKSNFVGEVVVRKGASEGELDVLFDLIPSKIRYDIKRAEDSLVISLTPF